MPEWVLTWPGETGSSAPGWQHCSGCLTLTILGKLETAQLRQTSIEKCLKVSLGYGLSVCFFNCLT